MKRSDLPAVAFTITPSGRAAPLFYGRGVGSVFHAEVKPDASKGGPYTHVLELKIALRSGDPVPWGTLVAIAERELADGTYPTLLKG